MVILTHCQCSLLICFDIAIVLFVVVITIIAMSLSFRRCRDLHYMSPLPDEQCPYNVTGHSYSVKLPNARYINVQVQTDHELELYKFSVYDF